MSVTHKAVAQSVLSGRTGRSGRMGSGGSGSGGARATTLASISTGMTARILDAPLPTPVALPNRILATFSSHKLSSDTVVLKVLI